MAKRVGYHSSNLSCRKPTCGASDDPNNYSNIGVAAHIRAAARGGKRYNLDISNVIDILTAIRRRLSIAAKDGSYYQHRNGQDIIYEFHDPQLEMWLNSSREEILRIMSTICKDIGVPELRFPRYRYS